MESEQNIQKIRTECPGRKTKKGRKNNLYDFIITKGFKKISALIVTIWELQNTPPDLSHSQNSRLNILEGCWIIYRVLKAAVIGGNNLHSKPFEKFTPW